MSEVLQAWGASPVAVRPVGTCLVALVLVIAACGGGGNNDGDGKGARNPADPRRVPTATVPAQRGTPIAALDVGGEDRRASLPDTYIVKAGDTLGSVATELGVAADELSRANPGLDPRSLRIGQELRIPRQTPTPAATAIARGPVTPTATGTPGRTATPTGAATPAGTPARTSTPSASPTATASPDAATRTPTAAAGTATPAAGASGTYIVQSGDTACAIARQLGVSLTALAQANGGSVDALANLRIGQVLRAPRSTGEGPGC